MVWKSHTTSYLDSSIRKSRSWVASDFEGNSLECRQASEFIRGSFEGRYGAPLTGDTYNAPAATTAEAAANAAQDGVQARVLWGEDTEAHLDDGFLTAQDLPVPSPFWPGYKAYATGSDSGWGGTPETYSNRGEGAWGSPPPGASNRDTPGRAGHPSGGGLSQDGVGMGHPRRQGQRRDLPTGGGVTGGSGGGGGTSPGGSGSSRNSPGD